MLEKGVHHLVIVDEKFKPLSVISSFDFLELAMNSARGLQKTTFAEKCPHRDRLISLKEGDSLSEAAHIMHDYHVGSLVVLNEHGYVRGILTARDIVKHIDLANQKCAGVNIEQELIR